MPPRNKPLDLQRDTLPMPHATYRCEGCAFIASFDE
jgi:hypothetical protein